MLITPAEYAKQRGVTPQAIRRAVEEGRITWIDGNRDPAEAMAETLPAEDKTANALERSPDKPASK